MPSTHAFSEKVALIADGTTPVGKAVALQLALCGAYVIVAHPEHDIDLPVIEELKSLGTLAAAAPYSKTGREKAFEIADRVEELYGRLDLLVNCSAEITFREFSNSDDVHFFDSMEKRVQSVFFVTKECLRLMKDRPKPKIVNIFSACDSEEGKKDVVAVSANAAIEAFTVALARNLPSNYSVNGICVSEIEAPGGSTEALDSELFRSRTGIDPDDTARAVLFLLSPESKGLNGQILKAGR